MRIGINCSAIDQNYKGGINTYAFGLLDGFSRVGSKHRFQIYVTPVNAKLFERYRSLSNFEVISLKDSLLVAKKALRMAALHMRNRDWYRRVTNALFANRTKAMDSRSDVVYVPTTVLYCFDHKRPTVLSMHDIQQCHYPQFFTKRELLLRETVFALSAKYATRIQASSEFIRGDLLTNFPILSHSQITVIPEGVDIALFAEDKDTTSLYEKYNIPDEFLFFPAQLWPHKNHLTVLKALKQLQVEGVRVPLVLTGAKYAAAAEVFEYIKSNAMDYVFYLGKVPSEDLLALYKKARYLVNAVLYESSSLPILEAAASGTAIIASRTPPNIEMSRFLDLNLFDPLNVDELVSLIRCLWIDRDIGRKQANRNKQSVERYSWNNIASAYLDLFQEICDGAAVGSVQGDRQGHGAGGLGLDHYQ